VPELTWQTALDAAIEAEKAIIRFYRTYLPETQNEGLKLLIRSISNRAEEHINLFEEKKNELSTSLKQNSVALGDKGKELDSIKNNDISAFTSPNKKQADLDFLKEMIRRENVLGSLYKVFSEQSENEDISIFFKGIADDQWKQCSWAQDRYDLESLSL